LLKVVEELRKKTTARTVMFLVQIEAHRLGREPTNKKANIQTDKAFSGKVVPTKWHEKTDRTIFT